MRLFAATIFFVSSFGAAAFADAHSAETEAVVMSHLRAFGQMDAQAMADAYADDAKIVTPDGVYTGAAEIRDFMESFVAEFSQEDISMETLSLVFEGDVGLITWKAETGDSVYDFGTDTYIVEDGKIVRHTYGALVRPKQ